MYKVVIANLNTGASIKEVVHTEKEIDELIESMYSVFGDDLQIDITKLVEEDEIETKRFSEKPPCICTSDDFTGVCSICGYFSLDVEPSSPHNI